MSTDRPTDEMAVIVDAVVIVPDPPDAPVAIDDRHKARLRVLLPVRADRIAKASAEIMSALGRWDDTIDAAIIRACVRAGIVEVAT